MHLKRRNNNEHCNRTIAGVFEEPFWVGIFERISEGKLSACKVTFGAEPKDYDVWKFVLNHYDKLRFSPDVYVEEIHQKRINPKRLQREVKRQIVDGSIGTKSQQALKFQQGQGQQERKMHARKQKEAEKQFLLFE